MDRFMNAKKKKKKKQTTNSYLPKSSAHQPARKPPKQPPAAKMATISANILVVLLSDIPNPSRLKSVSFMKFFILWNNLN